MHKKTYAGLALMLGLLIGLTGCSAPVGDLMAEVKAAEKPASPDEPGAAYIQSVADFSWNLFRQSTAKRGNILISPASVYLALAMTLNGADTDTRTAMLKALSAGVLSVDQINAASRDWMTLLMKTGQDTLLSIANSIWYRDSFQPDRDFLQRNADYFSAAARTLNFDSASAPATINDWVKKATNKTIDKIIDQIDPNVVMYLINAVYFKAKWQTPFVAQDTRAGSFAAPAGAKSVPFMNRTGTMDYLSGHDAEGVLLPYKDGRYAFVALLPAENSTPRDLVAGLDAAGWLAFLQTRQATQIGLSLPKFESRFEDSLVDDLQAMGMAVAFDPQLADFSLMHESRLKNLFISEVKHKTFCRVDEAGTEAAAVTSVEIQLTSLPVSGKTLIFDRPFLYGIVDTLTGLPLFLGVMEDPSA